MSFSPISRFLIDTKCLIKIVRFFSFFSFLKYESLCSALARFLNFYTITTVIALQYDIYSNQPNYQDMWNSTDRFTTVRKNKENYQMESTKAIIMNLSAEFRTNVARIIGAKPIRRLLHFGLQDPNGNRKDNINLDERIYGPQCHHWQKESI